MEKTNIRDLVPNKRSKICGFVEAIRKTKNNYFVVLRDRSQSIQLYINVKENPEMVKTIDSINVESTVEVIGIANLNLDLAQLLIIPICWWSNHFHYIKFLLFK